MRRTLKQAFKEDSSPELLDFVFGEQPPASESTDKQGRQDFEFGAEKIVPISKIHKSFSFTPDRKPVRYHYDMDSLKQWAESDLKPNGVRTALWTRPIASQPGEYELVAGLRRLTGCELVGILEVPIKVFDWNDEEAYLAAFDENDRRHDFSKLEELDIVLNLLSKKLDIERIEVISLLYRMDNAAKGKTTQNVLGSSEATAIQSFFVTRNQISWQSFVSTRLPLLKKPPEILDSIRNSQLEYTKAVEISRVKNKDDRTALLKKAIKQKLPLTEVKKQVKALTIINAVASKETNFRAEVKEVLSQMDKANLWDDPDKQRQIRRLLVELKALAEN